MTPGASSLRGLGPVGRRAEEHRMEPWRSVGEFRSSSVGSLYRGLSSRPALNPSQLGAHERPVCVANGTVLSCSSKTDFCLLCRLAAGSEPCLLPLIWVTWAPAPSLPWPGVSDLRAQPLGVETQGQCNKHRQAQVDVSHTQNCSSWQPPSGERPTSLWL